MSIVHRCYHKQSKLRISYMMNVSNASAKLRVTAAVIANYTIYQKQLAHESNVSPEAEAKAKAEVYH